MSTLSTPQTQPASHVMGASNVDSRALERDLKRRISGEVRFDVGSRALYATDGSNYRQVPIGVVIPKNNDDVIAAVEMCRKYGAPILGRGGGTSLAGQCCNVAVIFDFSKYMHKILELDPKRKIARVQPGVVLDWLRNEAEKHHLTFAPDPSTHNHCTLGGMIGNNSCGVHSVMGGKTEENTIELDILLYEGLRLRVGQTSDAELERIIREGGRRGEIYERLRALRDQYADEIRKRYPQIPRRVSGYNLNRLLPENGFDVAKALVGTESTCAMVLEATLRLVDSPPKRSLLVLGYPDVYTAGDHIMEVLEAGPVGLEGVDDRLIDDMKRTGIHPENTELLPKGGGWLLVEFGGETKDESDGKARKLMEKLKHKSDAPTMKLYDDPPTEEAIWKVRESGLGATAHVPGAKITWEGWEDSAVPPEKLGGYLRDFRKLLDKYGYACCLYGHFGQGCVHTRIDFDLETAAGIKKFREFLHEAADTVVSYGGSLSGEHGDGQSKAELLPKMFGNELIEAFNEYKSIWDPAWKMNPGKVVKPYRVDQNLRLGADYAPPHVDTHFSFPDDHNNFGRVSLRCVGIGECRRQEKGTMCPSYRVTMEEKHSTRGRARLLFEMLEGNPLSGGWKSEEVHDALDLCLACKGCKGDCPVNVDMATYKAEFLSHYYEGRLRPRHAYAMGWIFWWARLASLAPNLVNLVTHMPILGNLAKWAGGIAQQRSVPKFASQTFKQWFRERAVQNAEYPPVILWPDTFNNHFHPQTAKAAVEVLEDAGFRVLVPQAALCCGRPLYDFGMLDTAKQMLRNILTELQAEIRAGIPMVGLEPSCAAVFRDELKNLMPDDEDAKRLREQIYTLAEFLQKKADYHPPQLKKKAVVHGHCHQKAIMKFESDKEILKRLGLDFEVLDSGCCGMAGSFGFEQEHYDVSMDVGELKVLPAVRATSDDTLLIADGFSCREQIQDGTDRHALHLAEVLQMALEQGEPGREAKTPELTYDRRHPQRLQLSSLERALCLGVGAVMLGGLLSWKGRKA